MRQIKPILYILFALSVLSQFILVWGRVPSSSMTPTLPVGSDLVVSRVHGAFHEGEIVVFDAPNGIGVHERLIKRIEGLPGDRISVTNGHLYRNGQLVKEPFTENYSIKSFVVPAGHLFVLGDNRNHSYDSHVWGFVPYTDVIGVASFMVYPTIKRL